MPMSRGICCHVGGQIDFDGEGNLFLSTGDDTNPFQSAGYAPLDDRVTRNPAFDARRTSGQHERPPRQAPAHPRPGERRVHRPARQPVPAGPGADPSRDLRDGLPQPVPLRGQPGERGRLRRGLLARRPGGGSGEGPRGHRQVDDRPPAGQLRLAVLHHAGQAVRRLRLHAGYAGSRATSSTATRRRTTRATTPACAGCRRSSGRTCGTRTRRARTCSRSCSTPRRPASRATASGRWAVRRCSSTAASSRRSGGRARSRGIRSSTSGRGTTRRCSS